MQRPQRRTAVGSSLHSSPDSVGGFADGGGLALAAGAVGMPGRLPQWPPGAGPGPDGGELLDIWDTMWCAGAGAAGRGGGAHAPRAPPLSPLSPLPLTRPRAARARFGVGTSPPGSYPPRRRPTRAAKIADPLAGMPLPPLQQHAAQQHAAKQAAAAAAAAAAQQQRGPSPDLGQPGTPSEEDLQRLRPVSASKAAGAARGGRQLQQQQAAAAAEQEQALQAAAAQLLQAQQELLQAQPAQPYVLGTWTQRQFKMPQAAAAQAAGLALPGTSLAQPIPLLARPGSSGGSGGAGSGGAAAGGAEAGAEQAHGGNAAALAAAAAAAAADAAATLAAGSRTSRRSLGTDDEEEAVAQAAWRWRFARRWQAEQARPPADPAAPASVGDGGMEDALAYLAACGENWHLARAASAEDAGGTAESRMLGTLGTPSLLGAELLVGDGSFSAASRGSGLLAGAESGGLIMGGLLSCEASHTGGGGASGGGGGGGAGRGAATQEVSGLTKRAAQLLAAQSDIDKAVAARWREVHAATSSELWVGALLESVQVDDWGSYKFLLLRLRDRAGRTKLLVRGANYASDAKLVEGLHRQMMAACAGHDVRAETIEVVGGGVMEWRRHRDRHLHISGGYVAPASGAGGPSTAGEVMSLAAVLTKQHLPMHYKVTSEGGKAL
ncbi:hypothetical protein HT031_004995 [Scenedesmus sp. PABB004]|nr:hypothetical protein HT031_004995 [Scenedesmus sp. PABB004]